MSIPEAFVQYVAAILTDGDHLNDWLTHMPAWLQGPVEIAGYWLARLVEEIHTVMRVLLLIVD